MFALLCGLECGTDLSWMMSIVVYNGDTTDFALVLEATFGTAELIQTLLHIYNRNSNQVCQSQCSNSVIHIVAAWNMEYKMSHIFRTMHQIERAAGQCIVRNICGIVVSLCRSIHIIVNYLTVQTACDGFHIWNRFVNNQSSVRRKLFCKESE